jgi:glycosyltransferase involved in cell wall biosynthesis
LKVLCITPAYPSAANPTEGLFNYWHARALSAAGADVEIIVCKPRLPEALARTWRRYRDLAGLEAARHGNGLPVSYARHIQIPRYVLPATTVASCAEALSVATAGRRYHIVHAQGEWPVGMAAPAVADAVGARPVVTMHIAVDSRLHGRKPGRRMLRKMAQRAVLAAVGRPLVDAARSSWLAADTQVVVIPNGVEIEGASPRIVGISGPLALVSICNLVKVKGVDITLQALASLAGSGRTDWSYTIIGDGPERSRLEAQSARLGLAGRVRFLGRLDHPTAVARLAEHDLFVLPSWQEGFGVVYLEALALGVPVIGCRGQGAAEIVRDDIDGLLVEPRSVDSLASAIRRVLDEPALIARWRPNGVDRASAFTWERNAAAYLELYTKALA